MAENGDKGILEESREGLAICIEDEQDQRKLMLDDLRFACLDQWPADLRSQRENDIVNGPRPCLTVDQVNQYITQVANDMAANRPSIKTRPVDDVADPDTAKIFQGLVRHIEDQSSAHIAYQTSGESAVTMGLGYFRIMADYVSADSFDQELLIKRVPDTFSVYLSSHIMPDGSDADKGWVFEKVPLEKFKRDFPKAKIDDSDFSDQGVSPVWKTDDYVVVCEYFYKHFESKELLFLADGRTIYSDEYDGPEETITGKRTTQKVSIKWCKHTGCEVLDSRDLPGKYIPIVEEVGKEKIVEGKRVLWGLVRPAKDSLRAYNYWISAMTEKMALSPKAPFIGAVGQFATQGEKWDKANVNNYSKLEYDAIDVNGNAVPPPRRQEPMQMEAGMAQMLSLMQNNVKSSLGMYKASIGDTESQQSGRAILALKKESDTGTAHFGENQAISVTHCGRILVDLIPHYYDTKRVLRILGEDGKAESASIDPGLQEAGKPVAMKQFQVDGKIKRIYNLNVGKYDVTVTTGPGYTTSRQEASTIMTELANSAKDPVSAAIMRYGAVKNSDFHGSEEIMRMLKAMLPPQLQQPDDTQLPPEAMQKIGELTQKIQAMQQQGQELMQENQRLKSGAQTGMAKINADHDAKMQALALDKVAQDEKARLAREQFGFDKWLETEKANLEIDLNERKASAAQKERTDKLDFEKQCRANEESASAELSVLPQSIDAISKMAEAIANVSVLMEKSVQIQEKTLRTEEQVLAHQIAPKNVGISNVKKGPDGRITGASISTTLQ